MSGGGGVSGAPRLWLQISLHDRTRTLTISTEGPQEAEAADVAQFTLAASLKGIGLSVVRSSSRELAYACVSEILLEMTISSQHTRADLIVSELRLDNQMIEAQLPVVLIRSAALRPRARELEQVALPPCVHVSVVKRAVPDTPGAAQVHARPCRRTHATPCIRVCSRTCPRCHPACPGYHPIYGYSHPSYIPPILCSVSSIPQVFPLVLFLLEEMELQVEESFITALAALAAQIDLGSANGTAPSPPPPPSRSNNRRLVEGRAPPKGHGRFSRHSAASATDAALRVEQSAAERPERHSEAELRHGRGSAVASQAAPAPPQPPPPPMWVGEQTPLAKVHASRWHRIALPPMR